VNSLRHTISLSLLRGSASCVSSRSIYSCSHFSRAMPHPDRRSVATPKHNWWGMFLSLSVTISWVLCLRSTYHNHSCTLYFYYNLYSLHSKLYVILTFLGIRNILSLTKIIERIQRFYDIKYVYYENIFNEESNDNYLV
jgi:hypothetical protein